MSYQTTDLAFGALLHYTDNDSLTSIEYEAGNKPALTFDINPDEAQSLCNDFFAELPVTSARHLLNSFTTITGILRRMRRNNESSWTSESWICGRRG